VHHVVSERGEIMFFEQTYPMTYAEYVIISLFYSLALIGIIGVATYVVAHFVEAVKREIFTKVR